MLSTMTSRQAMSWTWGDNVDIQPEWLQELQSKESLCQIERATKYVHIRRGSKTWSTVLRQFQDDSYKLNYVEVEIGPPKPGRDGAERGPFIKLSGSSSDVNYSTIIFPDRDKKAADTSCSENRNSVGNGTSKAHHQKLERNNSKTNSKQLQNQQKLQQHKQMHDQELHQQQSFCSEQPNLFTEENNDNIIIPGTPSSSPVSRRRAQSTPTRNRKFPTEAELADAIKARQERIDQEPTTIQPKTRTLPTREKPLLEEELQVQEPVIMSKKSDHRLMKELSQDSPNSSQGVKSAELSHAMRAMQMKVRRKSSGEGYPVDFSHIGEHSLCITKSSSFGPKDFNISHQEPCAEIFVDDTQQSKPPVLKKNKSELEKAFARRKHKGGKSSDGDSRLAGCGDNNPSGTEASSPRDLAEPKSAKDKLRFNFPFFKSKSRGSPDGQSIKSSSSPIATSTELKAQHEAAVKQPHGRKPVPLPRGQCRESIESMDVPCSPKYVERPQPSPPQQMPRQPQQVTQPSNAWIDNPSFRQSEDEMYMNVAFSKANKIQVSPSLPDVTQVQHVTTGCSSPQQSIGTPSFGQEQQPLHRYENVFLEERAERLSGSQDRSSSSDSPRGSIEMSTNRPVPAPRHYGSIGGHTNEGAGTPPSHGVSHPGHCRKESWGNAATFASHGINPLGPHHKSQKHETPSGSPRTNELNFYMKGNIPNSSATVQSSHMQNSVGTGRKMSGSQAMTENVSMQSSNQALYGGFGSRSSGSLDNHSSTSTRVSSGDNGSRSNRGHRGSNASLGAGSGSIDSGSGSQRKISLERIPPSFANQKWYYGRMLRQECEYLMLSQGQSCQYLVRDSSHRLGDLMLSVLYGTKVHHYVIQTTQEGKFQIAHHDFKSVEDILDFYHHHVIMYSPTQEPVYLTEPFLLHSH